MKTSRIVRSLPAMIVLPFVFIAMLPGCGILGPTRVTRYILEPAPVASPARQPITGGIFLHPVEAADEYGGEYMVHIASGTRIISSSENMAWQSSAPAMVENAVARALAVRYPDQLRSSMFPPPEFVVRMRIERMAFVGEEKCDWSSAVLELRVEILKRREMVFETVVSKVLSSEMPVAEGGRNGGRRAEAMTAALHAVIEDICAQLEGDAGNGTR